MLGPILDLLVDAVDLAMTIAVLLALWDNRAGGSRSRLIRWLYGPRPGPRDPRSVQRFLEDARQSGAALQERSGGATCAAQPNVEPEVRDLTRPGVPPPEQPA